ncbi:unnamed protein product [Cladocopium goreaui]|uniref:Uncharacterized protein n=1 Tax=Cladocopium goreaui TaxID=2562237 RepID=A0A9P1D3E6_9DINO|nr:unnamed protein product [Cladocopium goreaui]
MGTRAQTSIAPYRHDPRTRLIELLKRWLRTNAANANISEEEVRRMCALCRDLLNYPNLFPSRNKTSFMHALSEAYEHLELQLRQVLERDRTCAELATRCLSLSRNLVSDAITFLLLAATHLTQTDNLPSLEVVVLWQSLPAIGNPLPSRADPQLQKSMQDAWSTLIGSLITSLLGLRWTFHLFAGVGTDQELKALAHDGGHGTSGTPGTPGAKDTLAQIHCVREEFAAGHFKLSGLAGPFREPQQQETRENLLVAVESLYDLLYLLGEVLLHFHRISDSLGDYGMIRVSLWLHPCLDSVIEKVQRLQASLKGLSKAVDAELVIAKARGRTVKKPLPSDRMSSRAHAAVERALVGQDCHLSALLHTLEELKTRSSPERLPHVVEGLGDACVQLQTVLTSPQFRARVGDSFPQRLPSLANMTRGSDQRPNLQLMNVDEAHDGHSAAYSDPEEPQEPQPYQDPPDQSLAYRDTAQKGQQKTEQNGAPADTADLPDADHSVCFFLFGQGEARRRSRSLSNAVWSTFRSMRGMRGPTWHASLPSTRGPSTPYTVAAPSSVPHGPHAPHAPNDLVSELSPDGWICRTGSGGRTSWHHTSLGPAPWDGQGREPDELFHAKPISIGGSQQRLGTRDARDTRDTRDTNPFSDDLEAEAMGATGATERTTEPGIRHAHADVTGFQPTPSVSAREQLEIRLERSPVTPVTPVTQETSQVMDFGPFTDSPFGNGHAQDASTRESRRASTMPGFMQKPLERGCLRAEVQRLTTGVQGWKAHDSRSLLITGSQLLIYQKGSTDQVKTVVDICDDVEQCSLLPDGVLSLEVRRKRRRSSSLSRFTPRSRKDLDERKLYFFKFEPQELAQQFNEILSQSRGTY